MATGDGSGIWEYLVIPEAERERLPELGNAGWELVAVAGSDGERLLYLKRPGLTFRERVTLQQRERYLESRSAEAPGKTAS